MRVAQELMNKPIITVDDGIEVGKVQGFYIDQNLTHLLAISLGSEGLLKRKETLIKWLDVITLGQDAILVKNADCVMETSEVEEFETFMWRDDIIDQSIDTPGGTKIGRIGDIVIDDQALIAGFALSHTYVSGPIAANRAIDRKSVIDIGQKDGALTADLSQAERADLHVVYEGFFAEPSVAPAQSDTAAVEAQPIPS